MAVKLELGDLEVEVVQKKIKNTHLSVHPPAGRVRISAPKDLDLETIRLYAISKMGWIRTQQRKLLEQERETPRDFIERESHYVWGKRYLMSVKEKDAPPAVELTPKRLVLYVRPRSTQAARQQVMDRWTRELLRPAVEELIEKWQSKIGVTADGFYIQRMKTRWGSCNSKAHTIRINSELAKKPKECLEYIVVHELIHIHEPTHNERFMVLMNRYMPDWKQRRQLLNHLPIRHEDWAY